MSNKVIIVNCANVKAAQTRLQMSPLGMRFLADASFALDLLPVLETLEADGPLKWSRLAKCLNERGLVTPAGKRWGPVTVDRSIATLADVIRMSGLLNVP